MAKNPSKPQKPPQTKKQIMSSRTAAYSIEPPEAKTSSKIRKPVKASCERSPKAETARQLLNARKKPSVRAASPALIQRKEIPHISPLQAFGVAPAPGLWSPLSQMISVRDDTGRLGVRCYFNDCLLPVAVHQLTTSGNVNAQKICRYFDKFLIKKRASEISPVFRAVNTKLKSYMKQYHVYIMTNKHHTVLYVGLTSDLKTRVWEHKSGQGSAFTIKYKINKLVFIESHTDPNEAIKREKQIKRWRRQKKITLIESMNPNWEEIEVF